MALRQKLNFYCNVFFKNFENKINRRYISNVNKIEIKRNKTQHNGMGNLYKFDGRKEVGL